MDLFAVGGIDGSFCFAASVQKAFEFGANPKKERKRRMMKWLIGIVVVVGGSVAIELVFEEYSFLWLLPFWMTVSTLFVSLLVLGEIPRRDYLRWKEFRNKAFWDEVPFVYSWLTVMAFACLFGGKPGVLVGGVVGFFYSLRVFRDVFALRRRFEKAAITQKPSD